MSATQTRPQKRPAAPREPVATPDGTQLVLPSSPFEDELLTDVMVRVTRQLAGVYWRRIGSPRDLSPADLYAQARQFYLANHIGQFDTWFVAYSWAISQGMSPAQYSADVRRRARGHMLNRRNGRPWKKQR